MSKYDQEKKVSEKGVLLDRANEYVAFPLRETALALRVLAEDGSFERDNAGKMLSTQSQSLMGVLKETFAALNKHHIQEIQSIPEHEKDTPENLLKLSDAQSVLASGIALNLPFLNSALLVIGSLYNSESANPFGDCDHFLAASGVIRYWILDTDLLCASATTSSITDKNKGLQSTEQSPGICRIVIRKTELLTKALLRQCDYTFGLSRLIPLQRPWFQNYLPAFQVYHPQLDEMAKEQSGLEPGNVLAPRPQLEHAFSAHGATGSDLLVLPSPLEFVSTYLCLLLNNDFRQWMGEEPTPEVPGPDTLTYRYSAQTREDLNDSLARTAFFLSTEPANKETLEFNRKLFISKGAEVKTPEKLANTAQDENPLEPHTLRDWLFEHELYGKITPNQSHSQAYNDAMRPAYLLDLRQACTAPKAVLENLGQQLQLEKESNLSDIPLSQYRQQLEALTAKHNELLLHHFKGHLLWGKVRALIDLKLMVAQSEINEKFNPFDTEVVAITQRKNQRGHLRSMVGFSVNLLKTPFDEAPFAWMEPFYNAPARACFQICATGSETNSNNVLRGLGYDLAPLTFLVNHNDKKNPLEGAFPENTAYNPAALYVDEDAARFAERELEALTGCDTNLIVYSAALGVTQQWFEFLQYPTMVARATLSDQSRDLTKSKNFRHNLFGVKI